jgi:intracellular multiplication protein IcmP
MPANARNEFAEILIKMRNHTLKHDWKTFTQMMYLFGLMVRLVLIPALVALSIYKWFSLPLKYKYRRSVNRKILVEQNMQAFPCIKPAFKHDLLKIDPFVGPWRYMQSQIEFCMEHGLLMRKGVAISSDKKFMSYKLEKRREKLPHRNYCELDVEKCDALLRNQLGKPWRGLDALPPFEKALAVCLMACALGGKLKAEGLECMNIISATFDEPDYDKVWVPLNGKKCTANLSWLPTLQSKVENNKYILNLCNSHAFESTVLLRLLSDKGGARSKGKLPPQNFLWLRPYNRQLFWTLHQLGGQMPAAEGSAVWSHYYSELDLGKAIGTPCIEGATDGLIKDLFYEEWITSEKWVDYEEKKAREALDDVLRADREKEKKKNNFGRNKNIFGNNGQG